MARKERIEFQRSEDFSLLDDELSQAMEDLDRANERIGVLLDEYKPAPRSELDSEGDPEPAGSDADAAPEGP